MKEELYIMYLTIKKFYKNLLIICIMISLFFLHTEVLKSQSEFWIENICGGSL